MAASGLQRPFLGFRPGLRFANRRLLNNSSTAIFGTQTQSLGNLFNGNEASARFDYNWNASNRMFAQFNWFHSTDTFGPCDSACTRGFTNPSRSYLPEWAVELCAHLLRARSSMNFGSATRKTTPESRPPNPEYLRSTSTTALRALAPIAAIRSSSRSTTTATATWSRSAMESTASRSASISSATLRTANSTSPGRRTKCSIRSTSQPTAPAGEAAGVDPGFANGNPAHLATNVRHWRNLEFGGILPG